MLLIIINTNEILDNVTFDVITQKNEYHAVSFHDGIDFDIRSMQ